MSHKKINKRKYNEFTLAYKRVAIEVITVTNLDCRRLVAK